MKLKKFDDLIVGKGIMGSFVAYKLLEKGRKILIFDDDHENNCSMNSSGLVSPISLHNFQMNQFAKKYFDLSIYKKLNEQFKEEISKNVYKVKTFKKEKERKKFESENKLENRFLEQLENETTKKIEIQLEKFCQMKYGIGVIKKEFNLSIKVNRFLNSFQNKFEKENFFQNRKFDFQNIKILNENIFDSTSSSSSSYRFSYLHDDQLFYFKNVIFCEGHLSSQNPYFSHLPWNLNKGIFNLLFSLFLFYLVYFF